MNISAKITAMKYTPVFKQKLREYEFTDLEKALSENSVFALKVNSDSRIVISRWVSAKRTRSYPYARVYDSLSFDGKKVTIIPFMKDEGLEGDRDFLQWDTISLMSLLGVYVIIGYYVDAQKNSRYINKITKQIFDISYVNEKIQNLIKYTDALHWNIEQAGEVGNIGNTALESYIKLSGKLNVMMHSESTARKRIDELLKDKDSFLHNSRILAEKAQIRESLTTQPKEKVVGTKATITIENYLGGLYYFTCDEVEIRQNEIYLIECKHSKNRALPSLGDIKEGLLKMYLFSNLSEVMIDSKQYKPIPVLKLTTESASRIYSNHHKRVMSSLESESSLNNFKLIIE